MSEKKSAAERAAAILERKRAAEAKIETSEAAVAASIGRAVILSLQSGEWPAREQIAELLREVAIGEAKLERVTPGMAGAAHDFMLRALP